MRQLRFHQVLPARLQTGSSYCPDIPHWSQHYIPYYGSHQPLHSHGPYHLPSPSAMCNRILSTVFLLWSVAVPESLFPHILSEESALMSPDHNIHCHSLQNNHPDRRLQYRLPLPHTSARSLAVRSPTVHRFQNYRYFLRKPRCYPYHNFLYL